ncbi:MAG: GNAT family N-acetyltransferase [Rhizobacter sp.]
MVQGALDALVADIIGRCSYRLTIAGDAAGRALAYRLRYEAVVREGWAGAIDMPDGRECDAYDADAVHILCWDGDVAVATGRIVLPAQASLPTEAICGITVEPRGRVVDVGRMAVAPSHQSHRHGVFIVLLARLYLAMQEHGYEVACGLMSARAQSLIRLLGLELEVLGDARLHWGELRAPVRFSIAGEAASASAAA